MINKNIEWLLTSFKEIIYMAVYKECHVFEAVS